jgi:RNA polymerase sigma-70 factor (ECF subfamily)
VKEEDSMEDQKIIELFFARSELAIQALAAKYEKLLYKISFHILQDSEDVEECLNDTYLGTWNAIPPAKPSIFQVFLSKIMRNIAVVRYKKNTAAKRVPSEMTVSLDELDNYVPYDASVEHDYAVFQISRLLSQYLRSLPEKRAFIFVCRHYCSDRISDIAEMLHVSESTIFRELNTIKKGLRELLIKEGLYHE